MKLISSLRPSSFKLSFRKIAAQKKLLWASETPPKTNMAERIS